MSLLRLAPFVLLLLVGCAPSGGADTSSAETEEPADAPAPPASSIVTVPSAHPADTTYQRLRAAIEANPNLTVLYELDHQANAATVGRTTPSSRLILFGNPAAGTTLMQAAPQIGLDLPLKMLVWADSAGQAFVTYTDPTAFVERYDLGIEEVEPVAPESEAPAPQDIVRTMRNALNQLVATATEA